MNVLGVFATNASLPPSGTISLISFNFPASAGFTRYNSARPSAVQCEDNTSPFAVGTFAAFLPAAATYQQTAAGNK